MIFTEPAPLALLASACFGLALVITQFGLRHMRVADGALVSISTTTVLLWLLAPFVLEFGQWQAGATAIFALVGLFFPAAVTLLTYESNRRMGPNVTAALGSTAPLFATTAAVLFLDERLTVPMAAGTAVVIAGIATLSWRPPGGIFQWSARSLLLPLAAALLRGVAQAVIKLGLAIWPSPFAAGLIGYSVSVVSVASETRLRRGTIRPSINARGAVWFALVGVCNGAAVLSLYVALSFGAVTIVAPIVATYPLFALVLGALMLPEQRFTLRSALGTTLTVVGVISLIVGR